MEQIDKLANFIMKKLTESPRRTRERAILIRIIKQLQAENARLLMRLGAASADKAWLTETDRVNAEQAALAAKGGEVIQIKTVKDALDKWKCPYCGSGVLLILDRGAARFFCGSIQSTNMSSWNSDQCELNVLALAAKDPTPETAENETSDE